ncbi:MAG TPA: hypothetical protein VK568_10835 [Thermodesulfobacteriota bacterium]|jgi:hypothetical protein|nr:hypothetical protein [Thermodesulfobacteriota bacterium]
MEFVEKVGIPKDVWVTCPGCKKLYYIDRSFYSPQFDNIYLHCPFCHLEFDKKESLRTWGD